MEQAILEGIGLTKSEISVYLALLELGSSTTGKIVDKSGASSSKIYEILDKLIQKGLVSYVLKANVKYFEAASPKRILDYIEEKKANISKQEEDVKKLLPELELKRSLAGIGSETQVFKGMKGAKTAFDDILSTLKKGEKLFVLGHSETIESFQKFLNQFHNKRSKAGIKCDIVVNELAKKDWGVIERYTGTRVKYIPKEIFTPFAFLIYKDKVLISIAKDQVFIQIRSQKLADGLISYFDFLWNQKTKTYVGKESIRNLFTEMLGFGDYVVYAEVTRIMEILGEDFFLWWQAEKKRRGIKSRGIMGEKYKAYQAAKASITNFKFIPGFENPTGDLFIFKDKVVNVVYTTKEPIAFLIDNKEVAENNMSQFEMLWNQKASTHQGIDSVRSCFFDGLDQLMPGQELLVIGIPKRPAEENKVFIELSKERARRGIKERCIVSEESRADPKNQPENQPLAEVKFVPETSPASISIFNNRVIIYPAAKDNILIVIDNKEVADAFRMQFDKWWDQKVQSYQGQDAVENAYNSLLEEAKQEDEVIVFAAKPQERRGAEYNLQWSKDIRKKVSRFRLIYYGYNETNLRRAEEFENIGCETKILPTTETVPISIVVVGNNILYSIYEKTPMAFRIDNKIVADSLRSNFELLWERETTVGKGLDALNTALNNYLDSLEPGETFNVLGVTFGMKDYSFYQKEFKEAFKNIHQKRADKGIKAKLLFQQADPAMIETFRKEVYNKNHEAKVLPFKTKFPVAILPSNNKTVLIIHKKEPSIITIDNKEASSAFKEYFDSMWQQDVRVYKGFEDVTTRFLQNMKEMKEGDEYYVLGSALQYQEKSQIENYFMDYHKERVKRKIKVKLLSIPESYDIIHSELAETGDPGMRYAELKKLPQEFKYPMQITLYKGNKISLISWSEYLCFEIESKTMYDNFKATFDMLWKLQK